MIDPEPPPPPMPPRTFNTPVRTRTALLRPVTWRPEPLDVVLVLGFLLLVGGIGLRFGVAEALIVAGLLLMLGWGRIAYAVGQAKAEEPKKDG